MPKKLELVIERDVKVTDFKTGKAFTYDRLTTEINKMKIVVHSKGTARDLLDQAFASGAKLYLNVVKAKVDKDDGTSIEYDQLFTEYQGIEIPLKALDSLGKKLIIKALQTE